VGLRRACFLEGKPGDSVLPLLFHRRSGGDHDNRKIADPGG
jgi:hypothetical protein